MEQSLSLEVHALLDAARRFAAVRGSFTPAELFAAITADIKISDTVVMVDVMSVLRADCTVDDGDWMMRPGPRRKFLDAHQYQVVSGETADLTPVQQALSGIGDYAPERLEALVEDPGTADITVLAEVLDQTGPTAPGYRHLISLRAALNTVQQSARNDEILAKGFFGREKALGNLAAWIATAQEKPPLRSWHISGLPGIGKSYLLEKVIQAAREDANPIMIRLDFDRAALDVLDPHTLFEELSRQMADGVPGAAANLRALRQDSVAERARGGPRGKMRQLPRDLLRGMAEAANATGRTLLIILDTLEVLRSGGETHIITLFEHLDLLLDYGLQRMVVVSAGRGDALAPAPERMAEHTRLTGLEDWAAEALLDKRGVDPSLWPRILPVAQGNPLLLALAGRALSDGAVDTSDLPGGADAVTIGGYLYRAILSRVPKALRAVANQGLILRAINVDTLLQVIAPALDLSMDRDQASEMLDALCTHHWLVDVAPDGWISHRSDVRAAFLPLIYADDPKNTSAINRAAADWFARPDPLMALYHRLQLTRVDDPMPDITPEQAGGFTQPMLNDLPDLARDAVLQAQGNRSDYGRSGDAPEPQAPAAAPRSSQPAIAWSATRHRVDFRPDAPAQDPDPRAITDLRLMLEQGDVREAQYILDRGFPAPFALESQTAVLVLCQQWQSGHWGGARRLWGLLGFAALEAALNEWDDPTGRLLLEIAAEFAFDDLVERLNESTFAAMAMDTLEKPPPWSTRGGALDFAQLVALGPDRLGEARDLTLGLLAMHLHIKGGYERQFVEGEAERLRSRFDVTMQADGNDTAPILPLNPYGGFMASALGGDAGVATATLEGYDVAACAALLAPAVAQMGDAVLPDSNDKIDAFEALGLTAAWAEGLTAYHRVADLPVLAAAATRWQRTIGGVWSYGTTPPVDWAGDMDGPDANARAILDHHLRQDDPVAHARAALRAWLPDGGSVDRLRKRFGKRYCAVLARTDPPGTQSPRAPALDALAALIAKDVPDIVAVPLAILAVHQCDLKDI